MDPPKIIVRYADGRIIKGYCQDFFPNKPVFHILPVHPEGSKETLEVLLKDLKALFFVRDFAGNPAYKEKKVFPDGVKIFGRKVEVTFKDGEVMLGSTLGYDPQRPGFFLFPSDSQCNNLRIFVVSQAVKKVQYV
jgi:hypothetical protein